MVEYVNPAYPVPTYRFTLDIDGDGKTEATFSAVSGLELSVGAIEHKDGSGNWLQVPGQQPAINVTLKRGALAKNGPLYAWLMSISTTTVEKRNCTISMTDQSGESTLVTWNIDDAFPVKLTAPSFDTDTNEIAIEEVSLVGSRITVELH